MVSPDIIDICTLLQCFGYQMKSLENIQINSSQETIGRTITLTCHFSGMQVVLESSNQDCSCPVNKDESSSYQVSGFSGGIAHSKETGSALFEVLPKYVKDYLTVEVYNLIEIIRNGNIPNHVKNRTSIPMIIKDDRHVIKEREAFNISSSMNNLNVTPPGKILNYLKLENETRYRSLDTLMNNKDNMEPTPLTNKDVSTSDVSDIKDCNNAGKKLTKRQQTYTCTEDDIVHKNSKTSSPIEKGSISIIDNLLEVDRISDLLKQQISKVLTDLRKNEERHESIGSLALDVSKISLIKGVEGAPKNKYSSSPNLSKIKSEPEKGLTKRKFCSSTSKLARPVTLPKPGSYKPSANSVKKSVVADNGAYGIYKSIGDRVSRTPSMKSKTESTVSPNPCSLTGPKKKSIYSHVKSTIPKPFSIKKD